MTSARPPLIVLAIVTVVAISTAASTPGGAGGAVTAATAGAATPPGKELYDRHCAECHGRDGKGDGPAAIFLNPRPRDFSTGQYKVRTTEDGSLPSDDDLARSVREGLQGSAMPAWKGLLTEAQTAAVLDYIKSFSPRFANEKVKTLTLGPPVPATKASVARGFKVYDSLGCAGCHGTDGRGKEAVQTTFEDDGNHPLRAADLTAPWTFRGGPTPRDIYLRFRTGMSGTPMPSFVGAATDAEMWDLANYVASLAGKPLWEMSAPEVRAFYERQDAEERADPVKRGAVLVESLECTLCHTPVDERQTPLPGMRLAGGLRIQAGPFGEIVSYNLTSDKETGLGGWTDDQIKQAVTRGVRRDGSRMLPFPMDWASYASLKPQDLDALIAYLRTVPPVTNRIPSPRPPPLPAYLWGKFKLLILGEDPAVNLFALNAGSTGAER